MSKYNRKQRTPKEDEFVSFWHKAYQKIEPYLSRLGVVLITACVIVGVVWAYTGWHEKKQQNAAEVFGRAVKIYDAELLTGDQPPPKSDEENPVPRFKTAKERSDAALAELDKLDKDFAGTGVAQQAAVFRAGVFYDQGRFDDAANAYAKLLKGGVQDPAVEAVVREGAGLTDEARGKLDDALASYKALESLKGDFYRDRALYAEARVFVKKGDKKKARELYNEALAKVPQTPLKDDITAHLAQLEGS